MGFYFLSFVVILLVGKKAVSPGEIVEARVLVSRVEGGFPSTGTVVKVCLFFTFILSFNRYQ